MKKIIDNSIIIDRFRDVMDELDISKKELASIAEVTAQTVSRWFNNKSEPKPVNLEKIRDNSGISLLFLRRGEGPIFERLVWGYLAEKALRGSFAGGSQMADEIYERIDELIDGLSINRAKLVAVAGLVGAIDTSQRFWLKRGDVLVFSQYIEQIAEATGYRKDWIWYGKGQRLVPSQGSIKKSSSKQSSVDPQPSNISPAPYPSILPHKVPVISWVQAGDWSEVVDQYPPGFAEDWIVTTETVTPTAFALVVHGDSMEPEFAEGDILTVDPGRAYSSGSYVVVKNGEEATFKQLMIDGSSVYLKPLNNRYPIKDVTGLNIRIVGVVIEKRKRY